MDFIGKISFVISLLVQFIDFVEHHVLVDTVVTHQIFLVGDFGGSHLIIFCGELGTADTLLLFFRLCSLTSLRSLRLSLLGGD